MYKKILIILAAAMFLVVAAAEVSAQEVLMNSAETINRGNLKLALFPTILFSKNGSGSIWGLAARAGIGLTSRFDIELKAATFKGIKYFGADAELWLIRGHNTNVSVAVGAHMTDMEGGDDSTGIDTAIMFSSAPARHLELYGGIKFAFDKYKNLNQKYTLGHFVPGIEYRISSDLDFLAEFGIALNKNSRSYASVGFALYLFRKHGDRIHDHRIHDDRIDD